MPSYKNMLLLTAAACPRPIFYLLLFSILRNLIWNEMWPQNGSSMFTAYFFIYHYSKYSEILYDMRCDHDFVWTQKVYFRCMEGLIAKTRIHTSTNTKLVVIDTSILYEVHIFDVWRVLMLPGDRISRRLTLPGFLRTFTSLASCVTRLLLNVRFVQSTRYCSREVKFISADPPMCRWPLKKYPFNKGRNRVI